jgi:hypothetical protein
LSRRWPSTNGPFFNERAIGSLFLHAAQTAPLGVPHLFKSTHRARHSVRLRAERTDKSRAQRVRSTIHNHRPAGLAQLVQHRLEWCDYLHRRFDSGLRRRPLYRSLHRARPASRSACCSCPCRSHVPAPPSQFCHRQPGSAFLASFTLGALVQDYAPSVQFTTIRLLLLLRCKTEDLQLRTENSFYLRRCSIMRSVRLLCRVFFPNVGKAQGVCGWLPFTLPSPPPCG